MKYLLIRHGKTDANRLTRAAFGKSGAPLNGAGKSQAAISGKEMAKFCLQGMGARTSLPDREALEANLVAET